MPSFDAVNYSLRPSKAIQRQLIFEGIRRLHIHLHITQSVYIGFGSIWFTDFVLAHQILHISDMISMEEDEIGFARARYNAPYATVEVRRGSSNVIIPQLLLDTDLNQRPWVVWLDYDGEFDEALREDTRVLVERAPTNTTLLITFNGNEQRYGAPKDRPERLRQLFGDVVPDDLSRSDCRGPKLQSALARYALDFVKSAAVAGRGEGGFVETVQMSYRDGASMVTVGGMLPAAGTGEAVKNAVGNQNWRCHPAEVIQAPHLTIREALALQAMLPSAQRLTRQQLQAEGFDLKDKQIKVYQMYYREYPNFAEIQT